MQINFTNKFPEIYGVGNCNIYKFNFIFIQLELSDNNFGGKELKNLPNYENLSQLKLANTKITSFEDINDLKRFKNLNFLELEESPISKLENYRNKIFEILPELVYLDNTSIDGENWLNGK